MAGVEYGRECYCEYPVKLCSLVSDISPLGGNSFQNGNGNALAASSCNIPCAAKTGSTCGGSWALSLFKHNSVAIANPVPASATATTQAAKPTVSAAAPSNSTNVSGLPSGWSAVDCASDVPGRTLNVDAYTSQQMTIGGCIAHCAQLGHTMAGLEYARECYCGSSFVNGGGAALADAQCNMPCAGDSSKVCGGAMALSVFKKTSAGSARRHKARHFGRGHEHSDMF